MKTFKLIGFLLMVALCAVSCSSDDKDDDYSDLIIGKWDCVKFAEWKDGGLESKPEDYDDEPGYYYTFKSDGTLIYFDYSGGFDNPDIEEWTWEINGNKLTRIRIEDNQKELATIEILDDAALKLRGTYNEDGIKYHYTVSYKRVVE